MNNKTLENIQKRKLPYPIESIRDRPYYDNSKKQYYGKMAEDLLGYGGEKAQKGALAALLSGLDAQIKIN